MGVTGEKFTAIGGTFLISEEEIAKELPNIKAFIFDWDGVFNNGFKDAETSSGFSEADSMGVNMLRFNHWRMLGKVPFVFIISGENNKTAIELAQREHFNGVYLGYKDKRKTLMHIAATHGLDQNEMAFIFDDILDVAAAGLCKLSFCVKRSASPLFKNYILEQKKCCYITGNEGGNHAVRELSELLIGLTGHYNETISGRIEYGDEYTKYIHQRNAINTAIEISK